MKNVSMLAMLFSLVFFSACEKEYLNVTGLSEEEEADLIFLMEEEKVAGDIYTLAFDVYGLDLFANMAAVEARHQEKLLDIIEGYGLTDPRLSGEPGQFRDSGLQGMYDALRANLLLSRPDAFRAAIKMEESVMANLRAARQMTDTPKLERLYANMREASHRQLRALRFYLEQFEGG